MLHVSLDLRGGAVDPALPYFYWRRAALGVGGTEDHRVGAVGAQRDRVIVVLPGPITEVVVDLYGAVVGGDRRGKRSEEHTSELQSRGHLVCRLLLEKKKHKT